MKTTRTLMIALVAAVLIAGAKQTSAQAPPGWRTFQHPKSGLKFFHPKEFKVIPVKPDEHLILGRFERPAPWKARKSDRDRRPETFVTFVLNEAPKEEKKEEKKQPGIVMGGGQAVGGDKKKKKQNEIKSFADYEKRKNAIYTWENLLKSRYRGQFTTKPTGKRNKKGEEEYAVFSKRARGKNKDKPVGLLFVRKVEGQTWGVLGFCDEVVSSSFHKTFRKIGRSMDRPTGFVRVRDTAASYYNAKDYKGIPFRIKARRAMVKGWKAKDTKNFFVLYHTKNMRLVNKIVSDLEAIQPHYQKMFPPVEGVDAVSVVRICKDVKEYMKYGGPAGSAGYWNPAHQELVFYDATKDSRSKSKKQAEKDSYIVLYHEGFHQFIFNGLAGVSPDYWFNEGMADYFSGSVFYRGSNRMKELGPNRWRIPRVKATVDRKKVWVTAKKLISYKRPQFYNPRTIGQNYAQAWSLCYFLLESKEAGKHPGWREIIPTYYKTLKAEAAKVKKAIEDSKKMGDEMSLGEKQKRYSEAGTKATKAAFKQIDLDKLEVAWKKWVRTMKDPWAAERPKPKKKKN